MPEQVIAIMEKNTEQYLMQADPIERSRYISPAFIVKYILCHNIIHGDTLLMKLRVHTKENKPIIFQKWTIDNDGTIKHYGFRLDEIYAKKSKKQKTRCFKSI